MTGDSFATWRRCLRKLGSYLPKATVRQSALLMFTFQRDSSQVFEIFLGHKASKRLIQLLKKRKKVWTFQKYKERTYKFSKVNTRRKGRDKSLSLFSTLFFIIYIHFYTTYPVIARKICSPILSGHDTQVRHPGKCSEKQFLGLLDPSKQSSVLNFGPFITRTHRHSSRKYEEDRERLLDLENGHPVQNISVSSKIVLLISQLYLTRFRSHSDFSLRVYRVLSYNSLHSRGHLNLQTYL